MPLSPSTPQLAAGRRLLLVEHALQRDAQRLHDLVRQHRELRAGKAQLVDSYVLLKDQEAWLVGSHISPLQTASTHVVADPDRSRKLLLNKRELARLFIAKEQKGYTCVALALYWKGSKVKCEIALAKGKKMHDKRATEKEKDWNRQKQRVLSTR